MAISPPALLIQIEDNGLGIAPIDVNGAQFKCGVSSLGTPGIVYNLSSPSIIRSTLGVGPLVDAAVFHANKSGKPLYLIPVTASVAGVSGSITKSNAGGPTITETGAPLDGYKVLITIATTGVIGVGSFTYSLDGGDSTSPTYALPAAGTFVLPNTGMTVTFPAAAAANAVINAGGGPTVTVAGVPLEIATVVVTITTGGILGTSQFSYTINGGTPSTPQATVASFLVPGTGITATFPAGTYILNATYTWGVTGVPYTAGDTYSWTTVAPGYNTTDLAVALTAMIGSAFAGRGVHVVGRPTTAAGCLAVASLVDSALVNAAAAFKYMWGLVETPSEDLASDSVLASTFASFQSPRVAVAAGTEQLFSDVTAGQDARRSSAWVIAPRIAAIPISQDVGWVGAPQGSIAGVNQASVVSPVGMFGLWRNETATPGLDAARFMTLRLFPLVPGIFITKGRMMSSPGSDFYLMQYRQVMDVGAEIAYAVTLPFLNSTLPTDPKTGFIDPIAASAIEAHINAALTDGLVTPGHASKTVTQIRRDNNILSTGVLFVKIRIQPQGYAGEIDLTIGFTNPALLAAA